MLCKYVGRLAVPHVGSLYYAAFETEQLAFLGDAPHVRERIRPC